MSPVPDSPDSRPTPVAAPDESAQSYSEQLRAYEARRRAADDILLAKMLKRLEPMNPRI